MLTSEIVNLSEKVFTALHASEALKILDTLLGATKLGNNISQQEKESFATVLLSAFAGYSNLGNDESANVLMRQLGLAESLNPVTIAELLAVVRNTVEYQHLSGQTVTYVKLQSLRSSLLALDTLTRILKSYFDNRVKPVAVTPGLGIIEVQIEDVDEVGITAQHLGQIARQLDWVNENLRRLHGLTESRLSIIYLDSGSNAVLGLQGAAPVINTMKELFEFYWEKIRHRKFDDFDRQIESATKGIAFLELVKTQIEKNVIPQAEGNRIQQTVLISMQKIVIGGAMLKTAENEEDNNRRKLLTAFRQKLLTAASSKEVPPRSLPAVDNPAT